MAGEKNYLPFVARESIHIPAGQTRALSVLSSVVSGKGTTDKIIYKDMHFTASNSLLIRYGFEGRGYLIEEPVPLRYATQGLYSSYVNQWRNGFEFPKPYLLRPGQQMQAVMKPSETGFFGCTLTCKRIDNGEPHLLYWSQLTATDETRVAEGSTMTCPGNTALYVHNFQVGSYSTVLLNRPPEVATQLYDGNGREVVTVKNGAGVTTIDADDMLQSWMNSQTRTIDLGALRKWEMSATRPLIVELESIDAGDLDIRVGIRGSVEVQE